MSEDKREGEGSKLDLGDLDAVMGEVAEGEIGSFLEMLQTMHQSHAKYHIMLNQADLKKAQEYAEKAYQTIAGTDEQMQNLEGTTTATVGLALFTAAAAFWHVLGVSPREIGYMFIHFVHDFEKGMKEKNKDTPSPE